MAEAGPQRPADTEEEEEEDSWHATATDTDTSDDDWFNRSLDDFEIPVKDRWDGEDESEDEEPAKGRGAGAGGASSVTGSSRDSVRKGVLAQPGKQKRADERRPAGEGGRTANAPRKTRGVGPDSDRKAPSREDGEEEEESDEESFGEFISKFRSITGPIVILRAGREQWRGLLADRRERDPAEESVEAPEEERDEEWFQKSLKELPTMFNLARIHSMSTARQDG